MAQTIITAGGASDNSSLESGNDGTLVLKVGPSGGKVSALSFAADGTPTFTKPVVAPTSVVTQANQTPLPSIGTTITFSHGLGYVPMSADLEFVCLTAEAGYVAGDVVNPSNYSASYAIQPAIKRTTTVVSTTTGVGNWVVSHASTGAFVNLTAANWAWRFKVRAT